MFWLRVPEKVYFKKGCMPVALDELGAVYGKKKAFIVTDTFLYKSGYIKPVEDKLNELNIQHTSFFHLESKPTLVSVREGAKAASLFEPDVIIAVGGGSAIDAAKLIRVFYEYPDADFFDFAKRFSDIRKRDDLFPRAGIKAYFAAIPTSSGTGSEVSPFAVVKDEADNAEYTIADYELLPDMAVVDADYMMNQPKELTAAAGLTALAHALEAYASPIAVEYTDGFALKALENLFEYLPSAYEKGADDPIAREKVAAASTMAGIAFANSFSGNADDFGKITDALSLTDVIRQKSQSDESVLARYSECAGYLGIKGSDNKETLALFIAKIDELIESFGIKKTAADNG